MFTAWMSRLARCSGFLSASVPPPAARNRISTASRQKRTACAQSIRARAVLQAHRPAGPGLVLHVVGAAAQQQLRHIDAARRIAEVHMSHRPLALYMTGIGEHAPALDVREEGLERRPRDAEGGAAQRDT